MRGMDENLLQDVVAKARAAGADAAEAVFAERQSLSVTVRLGALEEVEREESRDLGVRVFVGRRQAVVSGSDISADGRAKLIERAVAMARLAPEDPYAGLAPEDRLARGPLPDLDLFDAAEPDAESLEALALEAEDAARGDARRHQLRFQLGLLVDRGLAAGRPARGFTGLHRASSFGISAGAIAGDGSAMERAGEGRQTRWRADLPSAEQIGADAGRRAVGAAGLAQDRLDHRAGDLREPHRRLDAGAADRRHLRAVGGARRLVPEEQARRAGVFRGRHHHRRAAPARAAWARRRSTTRAWRTGTMNLIDAGVLTTWLLNTASARQLGLETTGHASRGLAGPPGVSAQQPDPAAGRRSTRPG